MIKGILEEQNVISIVLFLRISKVITVNVVPSSLILFTKLMVAISSSKRRFLHEPHVVISQKMAFFIVTAVKTSNLT
jgi:hypothetical protein